MLLSLLLLAAAPSPEALAILERHECHRCHEVEGLAPLPPSRSCAGCHEDIASSLEDPARARRGEAEYGEGWARFVERTSRTYRATPPLAAMGRFRAQWLLRYLEAPYDLRPRLSESMIRHRLSAKEQQALVAGWGALPAPPAARAPRAELEEGRRLFEAKGCPSCHAFGGLRLAGAPAEEGPWIRVRAQAPDLRHTRDRLPRAALEAYLSRPSAVLPGAQMPDYELTPAEVRALAGFVLGAPLGPPVSAQGPRPAPPRPGPKVPSYEEVERRVFKRVCWHCHSNPDFADGDGGPGNSGGLGFEALGLSFASYEELMSGSLGPDGARRSVFRRGPSGEPVLLERLRQRYLENDADHLRPGQAPPRRRVRPDSPRGMPLGLPALSPEDFALVERWVKAGRPGPSEPGGP